MGFSVYSTGTLSHDLNRFWQTKILRREDPYLKVGETNDRATKGNSDYVWALKDINLQKPLSLGHGQTSLAAALAHRVFKEEQGDVVGIIGRNGAGKSTLLKLLSRVTAPKYAPPAIRLQTKGKVKTEQPFHQIYKSKHYKNTK